MLKQNFQVVTGYLNLFSSEYFVELVLGFIFAIWFFYALYRRHKKSIVEKALLNTVELNVTATTPEVFPLCVDSVETALFGTVESNVTVTSPEKFALYVDSEGLFSGLKKIKTRYCQTEYDTQAFLNKRFDVIAFLDYVISGRFCPLKKIITGYPYIFEEDQNISISVAKNSKQQFIEFMKDKGYEIPEGGTEKYGNKHTKTESVDILFAMEVLEDAINNLYDTAIIITSRKTLKPLKEKLKKYGKRYIYVWFVDDKIPSLYYGAFKRIIFDSEKIQKFFKPAPAK